MNTKENRFKQLVVAYVLLIVGEYYVSPFMSPASDAALILINIVWCIASFIAGIKVLKKLCTFNTVREKIVLCLIAYILLSSAGWSVFGFVCLLKEWC